MTASRLVGARIQRKEDQRLVQGLGKYVDDVHLPNMLHLGIVRSPHAHARITRIDASKALALPGVAAVFTGTDIKAFAPMMPGAKTPGMEGPETYPLAIDKVCHVGEGVAAVVAADHYIAQDAVNLVDVQYEPLPAVVDPEDAMSALSPVLHEKYANNIGYRMKIGHVDDSFGGADTIIRQRFEIPRLIPNPMEPRGIVAQYEPGLDVLTLWMSTQAPFLLRRQYCRLLDMPENRVRVITKDVGGAFGSKLAVFAEELLAATLAKRLGMAIKWIETRQDHMAGTSHGRGLIVYVEAGVKRDAAIAALRLRIIGDLGAYYHFHTPMGPLLTALTMSGCYAIAQQEAEMIGVFTNKIPLDSYRGYYRSESNYFIQRLSDLIADALKIDPVEVRRRNFIQPQQFPYVTALGNYFDSGNYEMSLGRALEMFDYKAFREEQKRMRQEGRYIGVGFASYAYRAAFPSVIINDIPGSFFPGGWEAAEIRVDISGTVTVSCGVLPHGQGAETTLAQIVADELGVPLDDIHMRFGDTENCVFGMGSAGSRGAVTGGSAVYLAAQKIKEKAIKLATHVLGVPAEGDVIFEQGCVYATSSPERKLTLKDLANVAYFGAHRPEGVEAGFQAWASYDPPQYNTPFGTHICTVEVDADTGEIKVLRYLAADDCGRILNPMVLEGQIHGAVVQGLGAALFESAIYDRNGQLSTGSFLNYPIPKSTEVPMIETSFTETLSPLNPLGIKGGGENGTMGAPPAAVNAVLDALSPFGIKHLDMPLWPEKVWNAIRAARSDPP